MAMLAITATTVLAGPPLRNENEFYCHIPEGNNQNGQVLQLPLDAWNNAHGPAAHGGDYAMGSNPSDGERRACEGVQNPVELCEDIAALNLGEELPCIYPPKDPSTTSGQSVSVSPRRFVGDCFIVQTVVDGDLDLGVSFLLAKVWYVGKCEFLHVVELTPFKHYYTAPTAINFLRWVRNPIDSKADGLPWVKYAEVSLIVVISDYQGNAIHIEYIDEGQIYKIGKIK